MPIGQHRRPVLGSSSSNAVYWQSFREQVFKLIACSIGRLDTGQFHDAEETDISGEIVRAIEEILDDAGSPDWISRLSVHDDPPVHDPGRHGKRRRRLDLRIDDGSVSPRQRYAFEAKRLGPGHGVAPYLGSGGLRLFVDGHYSPDAGEAGMLGYVQNSTPTTWAEKIATQIDRRSGELQCDGAWQSASVVEGLHSYRTHHQRLILGRSITIFHLLLDFTA